MDWLKRTVQRSCSCNILKYLHALTTADGPHAGLANLGLQGLKEAQMSVDPRRHATQKLMKQAPRAHPNSVCRRGGPETPETFIPSSASLKDTAVK